MVIWHQSVAFTAGDFFFFFFKRMQMKVKSFLMLELNTDPDFFSAQELSLTFLNGRVSSHQLSNLYLQSFRYKL